MIPINIIFGSLTFCAGNIWTKPGNYQGFVGYVFTGRLIPYISDYNIEISLVLGVILFVGRLLCQNIPYLITVFKKLFKLYFYFFCV